MTAFILLLRRSKSLSPGFFLGDKIDEVYLLKRRVHRIVETCAGDADKNCIRRTLHLLYIDDRQRGNSGSNVINEQNFSCWVAGICIAIPAPTLWQFNGLTLFCFLLL